MSTGYSHLSKAGARVLDRLKIVPQHLKARNSKYTRESVPDFLRPESKEVNPEDAFKSEKQWKYLPGDRVVIMKGKHKGNVCVVKQLDKTTNGFILDENGPTKTAPVPKQFWLEGQKSHMLTVPVAIKQEDVRLVADVDDPSNPGHTRTVAVRDVTFNGSYYDANYKKMMPYRQVVGEKDLVIPWPKPAEKEEGELATDPMVAREQTYWVESLAKNPIPAAAFLTIRNPNSKFRRGKLTARDISKLVAPPMPLSAVKKARLAEREQLAQTTGPQFTEEDKKAIGDKIYQHLKEYVNN